MIGMFSRLTMPGLGTMLDAVKPIRSDASIRRLER